MNEISQQLVVAALLTVSAVSAAFAQDQKSRSEAAFDSAECEQEHSILHCITKSVFAIDEKEPLLPKTGLRSRSKNFYVVASSDIWSYVYATERKEDLLMVDQTSRATISFDWHGDEENDYRKAALKPLAYFIETLEATPIEIEVPFEPYLSNGVIYRLCMRMKNSSDECIFSSALRVDHGLVTGLAISLADEDLLNDVGDVLANVYVSSQGRKQ